MTCSHTRCDSCGAGVDVEALRAEVERLRPALVRAHCDLRWYESSAFGSVALKENALLGFDAAWERSAVSESRRSEFDAIVAATGDLPTGLLAARAHGHPSHCTCGALLDVNCHCPRSPTKATPFVRDTAPSWAGAMSPVGPPIPIEGVCGACGMPADKHDEARCRAIVRSLGADNPLDSHVDNICGHMPKRTP